MKKIIKEDKRLQILLSGAILIQVFTSISAVGFYHPDQHFQIIEYSTFLLNKQSAATQVWELAAHIRPTLQVYIFTIYYSFFNFIGISNPFLQLTILRIILGLIMLAMYNAICLFCFKSSPRKILYIVLIILNFSWFLPYSRTLYSSEMLSSLFFFGAILLYENKKTNERSWVFPMLTGFLFCLSFYFRFQIAFAIAGFAVWMLRYERRDFLPLAAGFLVGMILNISLDCWFYHEWVFTPYNYYYVNIVQGKAAELGTSSFLLYIGVLIGLVTVPPLSLILLYTGTKGSLKMLRSPFVLPILFFIVGHCMVSHKEERFLFPVINLLPLLVGWGLPALISYYQDCKKWIKYLLDTSLVISALLNAFLLVTLIFTPYSQAIYFTYLLNKKFETLSVTIYSIKQSPLETENGLQLVFYRNALKNIELKKISLIDSLRFLKGRDIYVSATYNHTTDKEKLLLEHMGFKPVMYASRLLWEVNNFLHSRKINTINDIWVLYKKE